jgi:LuxR family transcriptional regulator, maltose regulon positive regulatory protein
MQGSSLELPTGYYLERDSDTLTLRRLDGAVVGAFNVRGADPHAVRQVADEALREEHFAQRREEAPTSDAVQPSLQVRFFGHFEMLCDGETVSLGRNGKARTILKYLLANRSRSVSKDHLMGWLWPESNLKKARWSLNSAIRNLRKLLSACPSLAPLNLVLLEGGYYRLYSEVWMITDVDEFEAHYEEGRRLEKENRAGEAAVEYERAIDLYRDDYLVEDLYEDWTMVERERLSSAYTDVLGRLVVHYYENEQYQESIGACYRILEKDRCHEDSYRMLMRYYANRGLWHRALGQYRLCERILRQEWGLVPSSETQALYASLLSEHP